MSYGDIAAGNSLYFHYRAITIAMRSSEITTHLWHTKLGWMGENAKWVGLENCVKTAIWKGPHFTGSSNRSTNVSLRFQLNTISQFLDILGVILCTIHCTYVCICGLVKLISGRIGCTTRTQTSDEWRQTKLCSIAVNMKTYCQHDSVGLGEAPLSRLPGRVKRSGLCCHSQHYYNIVTLALSA